MPEQQQQEVWIACRAHGKGCGSNRAIIVSSRTHNPTTNQGTDGKPTVGGAFTPAAGGRHIRYKCLGCGGLFIITQ